MGHGEGRVDAARGEAKQPSLLGPWCLRDDVRDRQQPECPFDAARGLHRLVGVALDLLLDVLSLLHDAIALALQVGQRLVPRRQTLPQQRLCDLPALALLRQVLYDAPQVPPVSAIGQRARPGLPLEHRDPLDDRLQGPAGDGDAE